MEAVIEHLSDYELDRGKPMPNLTHGSIQANLIIQLAINYPNRYRIASEVSLATVPDGSTPDVLLYPLMPLSYGDEPARRTDAPLLCVEIQSPSQSLEQMVDKTDVYFAFGVQSCWIVAPAVKGVFVYDQPGQYAYYHHTDRLFDSVLDVELDLATIFA